LGLALAAVGEAGFFVVAAFLVTVGFAAVFFLVTARFGAAAGAWLCAFDEAEGPPIALTINLRISGSAFNRARITGSAIIRLCSADMSAECV